MLLCNDKYFSQMGFNLELHLGDESISQEPHSPKKRPRKARGLATENMSLSSLWAPTSALLKIISWQVQFTVGLQGPCFAKSRLR